MPLSKLIQRCKKRFFGQGSAAPLPEKPLLTSIHTDASVWRERIMKPCNEVTRVYVYREGKY